MTPTALVSLRGVTASYPGSAQPALAQLDLELSRGEIVGVSGSSGSGKSSLLRVLAGLLPAVGTVDWPTGASRELSYAPQEDVLLPYRTVRENAALLLERPWRGSGPADPMPDLDALLGQVGLAGRASELPAKLSGGMRQRVQVVQAVACPGDMLMLDEPFAQQDRDRQRAMEAMIHRSARARGQTVLIVSHDLDALAATCDRTILLGGSPAAIRAEIATPEELRSLAPDERRASPAFAAHNERLWTDRAKVALE